MRLKELADLHIGLPIKRWESPGGTEHRMLSARQISPYGEITREEDCGLLVSSYFAIIRCRQPGRCAPEYLNAFFNSPAFAQAAGRARICSTVQSLKLSTLQELEIPLPDPERQRSIAEFFALSNAEQKQLEALLTAKRRYHQFLLARQFGGDRGQ